MELHMKPRLQERFGCKPGMSFCKRRFNSGLSEFHITFKRLYSLRERMSIKADPY
ncbi:hypothetical protein CIRG_04106 [Coccidioides immitis RMSCC 2394]|uniref:Uncharacterized protein n=1 Tax=Coccidioides immitis RMSCC 2394 TaxID=404692 RepID=A0A0J6YBI9_COCIT|nr:hypothetical protein CIRG_04106 [Coccidioides immitis RMSCC 2394]